MCNHREWTLLPLFVDLPIFRNGTIAVGGAAYPNVGLICNNCGNTQIINAVISGVLEADANQDPDPANKQGGK